MIYCAGKIESFTFAKSIGVGLIESAMNLTQSIFKDNPTEIIFVGTCGCYDCGEKLLEIFETQSAAMIELSFLQKQSYTPLENFITTKNVSRGTIINENLKNKEKIVNSSNYISLDSNLAQKLLKLGIAYENMEFFSVLQVAKNFNLPALGIFCSTNYIHKDASLEFHRNHSEAMKRLEEYIRDKNKL